MQIASAESAGATQPPTMVAPAQNPTAKMGGISSARKTTTVCRVLKTVTARAIAAETAVILSNPWAAAALRIANVKRANVSRLRAIRNVSAPATPIAPLNTALVMTARNR